MVSKLTNKISFYLILIIISFVFNIFLQGNAEAKCARDSNNAIKVDTVDESAGNDTAFALNGTSTYDQDQCQEEPLFYRLKFYKLALCTSDPYNEGSGTNGVAPDLSSCTNIFSRSSNNGKQVVIQPNQQTELLDESLILPLGTYTHAYFLVSNIIDIKHYERYALASNGNAATLYGYASSGDQTGTYCWTREVTTTYNNDYSKTLQGRTIPAEQSGTSATSTMYCDSSAPTDSTSTYKYASEIIDHFGDDNVTDDADAFRNFIDYASQTGINGRLAGNLMQADETLATSVAAGVRLAGFQEISPTLVITEDTIGLELDFNISESISIDTSVNSDDEIHAVKVGADPFAINFSRVQY